MWEAGLIQRIKRYTKFEQFADTGVTHGYTNHFTPCMTMTND